MMSVSSSFMTYRKLNEIHERNARAGDAATKGAERENLGLHRVRDSGQRG